MKAFLALSESVGICTSVQLTVPQHVNINTDPVFNKTVLELATHKTARCLLTSPLSVFHVYSFIRSDKGWITLSFLSNYTDK